MFTPITTLYLIGAYLLGSISSAIIVCRIFRLPDPRTQGSNNPGATNVLRIGGKLPALITLIGDMLKGVIALVVAKICMLSAVEISCVLVAVFLGHLYPIFFRFNGGKGVATALGAFLALSWQFGGAVVISWLLVFAVSRISSVGALAIIITAPVYAWLLLEPTYAYAVGVVAVMLLLKHKDNIYRLWQGTEKKMRNSAK